MWLLNDDDLRKALAQIGWDWDIVKKLTMAALVQVVYEAQLRKVVEEVERCICYEIRLQDGRLIRGIWEGDIAKLRKEAGLE